MRTKQICGQILTLEILYQLFGNAHQLLFFCGKFHGTFFPARLNICSDLFPQHCSAFQPEPRIRGSSHLLSIEWILVCGSSARKIHRRTFLSSSPPFQGFGFLLGFSDSIPSQDFWALSGKSWQGHLSWVCEHRGLNAKCHGWQTSLGISPISCRFVNTQKISAKIRDGWSEYRIVHFKPFYSRMISSIYVL